MEREETEIGIPLYTSFKGHLTFPQFAAPFLGMPAFQTDLLSGPLGPRLPVTPSLDRRTAFDTFYCSLGPAASAGRVI